MSDINQILDSFYCPITHTIMEDPVICPEGFSFENTAILKWLENNDTSPITRNKLQAFRLRPNRALKESIDKVRHLITEDKLIKKTELAIKCSQEILQVLENSLNDISLKTSINGNNLHLKVLVPNSDTRAPSNIILVIDVSGSMSTEASMKNEQGNEESHGFSLLDIVKQASHTIRVCLTELDTLSIVSYSNTAQVVLKPTQMNDTGKKAAEVALNLLKPHASTNIWDGILTALELCRNNEIPEKHNKILLLTDGIANIIPPRGHIGMINKYIEKHGKLPASIDTFGFGYNLDSIDLNKISNQCYGNYGFIPDSTLVGDMFSNCLGNILSTASSSSQLMITFSSEKFKVLGNHKFLKTSWGGIIDTGTLYYGQNKDFVLELSDIQNTSFNDFEITLKYELFNEFKEIHNSEISNIPDHDTKVHKWRSEFVEVVMEAWNQMNMGQKDVARMLLKTFLDTIESSNEVGDEYIKSMIIDLKEQVIVAFSKDEYYLKWGKHYIPSLIQAHQRQICNNFKDPGVQHFGGKLFNSIRDEADDKYNLLPAPTPSVSRSYSSRGNFRGGGSAPRDMSIYNSRNNPCFHGNCLVHMYDGSVKRVADIRKGDIIMTTDPNKNYKDTVECVLKTCIPEKHTNMVELNNGWIGTPWHPVKINGQWIFPNNISNMKNVECDSVYTFLLTNKSMILVNQIESATLAHGLNDNVIYHPYFGTNAIINDLKKFTGWSNGYIEIHPSFITRDQHSGLVNGIKSYSNAQSFNDFYK